MWSSRVRNRTLIHRSGPGAPRIAASLRFCVRCEGIRDCKPFLVQAGHGRSVGVGVGSGGLCRWSRSRAETLEEPRRIHGSRHPLTFGGGRSCGASCCVVVCEPGRSRAGGGIRGCRRRRTGSPSHPDGPGGDDMGKEAHHWPGWWVRPATMVSHGARRTTTRGGRSRGRCSRGPAG